MSRRVTMFIWLRLHFLLAFLCLYDVSAQEQCPSLQHASLCESVSCQKEDVSKVKVLCVNIPSSFSFNKIFQPLDKIQIEALRIINLQVTNFTQRMFNHMALRDVSISNANITSLSRDAFDGTSLEYLSLINCNLTDETDHVLNISYIPKLKSLHLTRNRLETVKSSWFKLKRLQDTLVSVTLKQNKISLIEDKAFHTLKFLEYLDLSDNNIQTLKKNFFPDGLFSLSLGYNKIEKLPNDLFTDMGHLRYLRLESNRIKELKKDVFTEIFSSGHLRIADLRGNPIHCGCDLKWLPQSGKKPTRLYGECDSPEVLQKKPIARFTYLDVICEHSQMNGYENFD